MLKLRKSGAVPLLPLYAFMVWTRTILPSLYFNLLYFKFLKSLPQTKGEGKPENPLLSSLPSPPVPSNHHLSIDAPETSHPFSQFKNTNSQK
jgi:hypothetical protein